MFDHVGWGKKNRLRKIVQEDGRVLMLAIDHGYFMGPTHGMEKPREATRDLLPHVDALMLSPGILKTDVDPGRDLAFVLRASGGNSVLDPDIDDEELILSAKEAVRLNASAIAISVYIGTEHQHQTLLTLAEAINEAAEYDLPVLGVTAVGKKLKDKKEKRYLALASRIVAEYGADLVKTYYCDGFSEVVAKCPAPIVIAGGPKLETYEDVLNLTYKALQEGAVGVDMGRNIWQAEHPAAILQGVKAIVHGHASVQEALELVESLANASTARREEFELTQEDIEISSLH